MPGLEIVPFWQENVGRTRIPAAARNWAVGWIFCIDAIRKFNIDATRKLNRECARLRAVI
jgi:hypothetical protein